MSEKTCIVLVQHRTASEYNDFVGKFYHFPSKYLNLMSETDAEFVYFEPTTRKGAGAYFGHGKLGKVFEDKRESGHYFAEIVDYRPFSKDVPSLDQDGKPRESGPSYNPQNSARKVSHEIVDGICLDGGIILNFTADAHLVKVLGEELIATEVVGVLELVKNAYDANASRCKVRIEKIPDLPPCVEGEYLFDQYDGPVVIIDDDGCGMDRATIENGWMRPASILKTEVKERLKKEKAKAIRDKKLGTFKSFVRELKKQHRGRLPLGEKGVGRFATHRLGRHLIMTTKTDDIDFEYVLEIDWNRFDSAREEGPIDLSSIGFSLTRQSPSRDYGERNSGTRLIVYGGREGYALTTEAIRDINRSLLKLRSPREDSATFSVFFECPQVADLDVTPIDKEFDPVFSLDAVVDENGLADFDLEFRPPKSVPMPADRIHKKGYDLRKLDEKQPEYWIANGEQGERRMPRCGPFFLHVDLWYRSKPWIDGPNRTQFTDHLDIYGGISIYRDGLNVFPAEWGAEVDWLRLSKRHIKKGLNLSYYNMLGNLEIEQSANLELVDQTDRQGLLKNTAFSDVSRLVRNILFEVEIEFQGKRDKHSSLTSGLLREPRELKEASRQTADFIARVVERYDLIADTQGILEQFENPAERHDKLLNLSQSLRSLEKSLKAMQEVQDLLTEQAGYGLAIGVAVHEIAKITSNFYTGITKMLRQKRLDRSKLEELRKASSSLKTEMKRLGPLRAIRNEPPTVFEIRKAIRFCSAVFKQRFKKLGIEFRVEGSGTFQVYSRYGAVNQVISNLLDNSCYWLSSSTSQRRIINVGVDADARTLTVADSGPDFDESIRPYLFEPGYSLKVPPSGLGLYICRFYMASMGGNAFEANKEDRFAEMDGAHIVLDFSKVPAEEVS